jgi:hypothetical protein
MCITVEVRSQQYKNNHAHRYYYTFQRMKVLVQKRDEFCKGLIFFTNEPERSVRARKRRKLETSTYDRLGNARLLPT